MINGAFGILHKHIRSSINFLYIYCIDYELIALYLYGFGSGAFHAIFIVNIFQV